MGTGGGGGIDPAAGAAAVSDTALVLGLNTIFRLGTTVSAVGEDGDAATGDAESIVLLVAAAVGVALATGGAALLVEGKPGRVVDAAGGTEGAFASVGAVKGEVVATTGNVVAPFVRCCG